MVSAARAGTHGGMDCTLSACIPRRWIESRLTPSEVEFPNGWRSSSVSTMTAKVVSTDQQLNTIPTQSREQARRYVETYRDYPPTESLEP
jgi:hypothetical protein